MFERNAGLDEYIGASCHAHVTTHMKIIYICMNIWTWALTTLTKKLAYKNSTVNYLTAHPPPRTAMVADIIQEPSFHRLCATQIGKVLCGFLTHISPQVQAVIGGLLIWLVTVQAFRWKRYNAIHRQFQAKYYKEGITPEEAQKIIQVSTLYDMPLLLNYALAFALFKTYGIVGRSNSLEPLAKHYSSVAFHIRIACNHQRAELPRNCV